MYISAPDAVGLVTYKVSEVRFPDALLATLNLNDALVTPKLLKVYVDTVVEEAAKSNTELAKEYIVFPE
jgi:hypothetical protein